MKLLNLLVASAVLSTLSSAATLGATTEPVVSISALKTVEAFTNAKFATETIGLGRVTAGDPWDLVGQARGTWLPGYGVIVTFELSLVNIMPPLLSTTISKEEIKSDHDRTVAKLVVFKDTMRDLVVKAATSLTTLPPDQNITFEAYFFSFSFEDHSHLPRRLTMTATRQKLLDAVARKATPADLAALIEEREE